MSDVSKDLNDKLLELLKCQECYEIMEPPIYECKTGHSICEVCRQSAECPLCDTVITQKRNFTLENMVQMLEYPCVNQSLGCIKTGNASVIKEHSGACSFRDYYCKLDDECEWTGKVSDLTKHSLDEHDTKVFIGQENIFTWREIKPTYEVHLITTFGEAFYFFRTLKDDIMYWAVQYLGRSEDINLYCYQITLYTDQYVNRKIKISEICHDDIKGDIDELIETGLCIGIPMDILKTYVNSYNTIFYKVAIKQA